MKQVRQQQQRHQQAIYHPSVGRQHRDDVSPLNGSSCCCCCRCVCVDLWDVLTDHLGQPPRVGRVRRVRRPHPRGSAQAHTWVTLSQQLRVKLGNKRNSRSGLVFWRDISPSSDWLICQDFPRIRLLVALQFQDCIFPPHFFPFQSGSQTIKGNSIFGATGKQLQSWQSIGRDRAMEKQHALFYSDVETLIVFLIGSVRLLIW